MIVPYPTRWIIHLSIQSRRTAWDVLVRVLDLWLLHETHLIVGQVALAFQQHHGRRHRRRVSPVSRRPQWLEYAEDDDSLIVHSVNDPLKRGQNFDEERVLYLMDWM